MTSSLLIFLRAASVSVMIILTQCKVTYYNFTQLKTHPFASARFGNWIKNKKATINPINIKDNKCFQYAVTVASNYEEIKRITKIKSFINKYNQKGINSPSEKDDWRKFEKNNVAIALNVLDAKKEKIHPAYVSKITQIVKNELFF